MQKHSQESYKDNSEEYKSFLFSALSVLSDLTTSDADFFKNLVIILQNTMPADHADRVLVYEISQGGAAAGKDITSFTQLFRWDYEDGFQKTSRDASRIPMTPYFGRWEMILSQNRNVSGKRAEFPRIEQEFMEAMDINEMILVPCQHAGKLIGFVSYEQVSGYCGPQPRPGINEAGVSSQAGWLFSQLRNRNNMAAKTLENTTLKTQLDQKNQILTNLSHEIRTPMNGIVGLAEQLEDLEGDVNKMSFLESIKLSASNLMTVLTGIAEFAATDKNPDMMKPQPKVVEIRPLIEQLVLPYAEKAKEKKLAFSCTFDPALPGHLHLDFRNLLTVLRNVVDNAVKFTTAGSIRIRVSHSCHLPEPELILQISDTGIGIADDQTSRIFDKYTQIDQGRTRNFSGIGLGLSIVKNTLYIMQGSVEVESVKGEGSVFTLHIPARAAADYSQDMGQHKKAALGKLRILVVDDHPINRKVVTTILKKWGSSFQIAVNGLEAVEIAASQEFDIILMDIHMPVMDGYEATRKIRQVKGDKVVILALTASILKEDEATCQEVGMNGVIRKPFFPDNLLSWVYTPVPKKNDNVGINKMSDEKTVTDLSYLENISDGNKEFIDEMVNLFIDQSSGHLDALNNGIQAKNYTTIAQAAHKMKPVLEYVGITPDTSRIKELEEQAKLEGDFSQMKTLLNTLGDVVEQARNELNEYLNN